MRVFQYIKSALTWGRILWFIIAALLCVAVVFVFPKFSFMGVPLLHSETAQYITITAIVFIWGIVNAFLGRKTASPSKKVDEASEQQLPKKIDKKPRKKLKYAVDHQQSFKRLFGNFLQSNLGFRRDVNDRRRVLVMGDQAAGKTALFLNTKLNYHPRFQATDRGDQCSIYMTSTHCYFDVPGFYMAGDSNQIRDEFKDLVKRLRYSHIDEPIDHILLCVDVEKIASMTNDEVHDYVEHLRRYIHHVQYRLKFIVPIQIVLTQCDKILGFAEFFDGYKADQRKEALGFELQSANDFSSLYDDLVLKINQQILSRIHFERDSVRSALVANFPLQLMLLKEKLESFLQSLSKPLSYYSEVNLSGLFFASAKQTGAFFNLLAEQTNSAVEIDRREAVMRSRALFIENMLEEV